MENEILKKLSEIAPNIDFNNSNELITKSIIDSFTLLTIVSELEESFDIEFLPEDITPNNFNSLKSIIDLVIKRKGVN